MHKNEWGWNLLVILFVPKQIFKELARHIVTDRTQIHKLVGLRNMLAFSTDRSQFKQQNKTKIKTARPVV